MFNYRARYINCISRFSFTSAAFAPMDDLSELTVCFCRRQEFELTGNVSSDSAVEGASLEDAVRQLGKGT